MSSPDVVDDDGCVHGVPLSEGCEGCEDLIADFERGESVVEVVEDDLEDDELEDDEDDDVCTHGVPFSEDCVECEYEEDELEDDEDDL